MFRKIFFVIAFAVGFALESCGSLESTGRLVVGEHYFTIKPETILQSIAQGQEDFFSSVSSLPESGDMYPSWVNWDQSDYLSIANALYESVWNESLQNWDLNYASFSLPCSVVGNGFQSATLSFFQEETSGDGISRIERQIDIYPKRKLITVWEFAYDSSRIRWKSIELSEIAFTAEQVLMTAERSGGMEKRVEINNACEISVILAPNSVNYAGWDVLYSSGVYSVKIDPYTGKPVR